MKNYKNKTAQERAIIREAKRKQRKSERNYFKNNGQRWVFDLLPYVKFDFKRPINNEDGN